MDGRRANPILFDDLLDKPTTITFDEPTTSSDGGVILLNGADRLLGLTDVFVRFIDDPRQPGKIDHTVEPLIRQRIFGIACGYRDGNDAARLAGDPMMRLASGRSLDDESDAPASQPTLSRFENSLDATTLLRIGCRIAEPLMKQARAEQKRTGETARGFGECPCATRSWSHERRIIIKAEVTVIADREPRDNGRFVVTNLRHKPENVYRIYRKRGDVENRIKELLEGVDLGRTSCTAFLANAFRVLLSTAASMLFQVLRDLTDDPRLRRAQVRTLRERLLKVAARVRVTWRRLHIALPESYVWANAFRRLAIALRARPSPAS